MNICEYYNYHSSKVISFLNIEPVMTVVRIDTYD